MQIIDAKEAHIDRYAGEIPDLMHSTGPVTYDYQFNGRERFDWMVDRSWRMAGTLFAWDGTTLALDGEELLGIEVGFPGPEFEQRKKALAPLWAPLIESGGIDKAELATIAERSFLASFLNVAIPRSVRYIHALAVKPVHQGKGVGAALVRNAMDTGKAAGLRGLHLDVLSDNPAVEFYRAPRPGMPRGKRLRRSRASTVCRWRCGWRSIFVDAGRRASSTAARQAIRATRAPRPLSLNGSRDPSAAVSSRFASSMRPCSRSASAMW